MIRTFFFYGNICLATAMLLVACRSIQAPASPPLPQYSLPAHATHLRFDPAHPPALRVPAGAVIEAVIREASDGYFLPESNGADVLFLDNANFFPLSGPIYIDSAEAGDLLAVTLHSIEIDGWGWSATHPDAGLLIDEFHRPEFRPYQLPRGTETILFSDSLHLLARPFPAILGLAPAAPLPDSLPGWHGGDYSDPDIRAGTTLYLPVQVQGGLLSLGDGRAIQGHGAVGGIGISAPLRIVFEVRLHPTTRRLSAPEYENQDIYAVTGTGENIEAAAAAATRNAIGFLEAEFGLSRNSAYALCSSAGNISIGRLVSETGVRVALQFPQGIIRQLRQQAAL